MAVVSRNLAIKIPASKISSQAKSPDRADSRADSRNPTIRIRDCNGLLPQRECWGIFYALLSTRTALMLTRA